MYVAQRARELNIPRKKKPGDGQKMVQENGDDHEIIRTIPPDSFGKCKKMQKRMQLILMQKMIN